MKVFISYAAEDRDTAEQIHFALLGEGHTTFFDRDDLPPAQDFHTQIRLAVEASDALVFLISPESVAGGSYALTELTYARRRWPHPKGIVLPVFTRHVDWSSVPNYLKSVTVLTPSGDVAAEVLAELAMFPQAGDNSTVRRPTWGGWWRVGATVALIVGALSLLVFRPGFLFSPTGPPPDSAPNDTPSSPARQPDGAEPLRILVRKGEAMMLRTEVTQLTVPYSVSLDGKSIISSMVGLEEPIADLPVGDHRLAWAFTHSARQWRHRLTVTVGGRAPVVLEEKSESAGDTNSSLGFATVSVTDPVAIRRFDAARGERLVLKASVGPMDQPYAVSIGGTVRIRSLKDREEFISDLPPGEHVIGWTFSHTRKGWHHRLTLGLGTRAAVTLDQKSEAAGDSADTVGAIIIAVK